MKGVKERESTTSRILSCAWKRAGTAVLPHLHPALQRPWSLFDSTHEPIGLDSKQGRQGRGSNQGRMEMHSTTKHPVRRPLHTVIKARVAHIKSLMFLNISLCYTSKLINHHLARRNTSINTCHAVAGHVHHSKSRSRFAAREQPTSPGPSGSAITCESAASSAEATIPGAALESRLPRRFIKQV